MKKLIVALLTAALLLTPGAASAQNWDANQVVSSIAGPQFLWGAEHAHDMASIRVVRISTLAGADLVVDRLATARDIKDIDITYLQSQLWYNHAARVAIRGAGVGLEQIVAIYPVTESEGIIYADDL